MKKVTIYTDGACSGNPGVGGWAAILIFNGVEKEISGYDKQTTNNRMELFAVIQALRALKESCEVEIYTDSAYVADAFLKNWITSWEKNNWHKIKNVNALIKAGEIYENVGRYEESRDILLMAYDRSPIGRMIIYRLAEVAIKMGNCEEARDYYQEFVEIAPHDNLKYVLRYEISKAEGADLQTLIGILEELKEQE